MLRLYLYAPLCAEMIELWWQRAYHVDQTGKKHVDWILHRTVAAGGPAASYVDPDPALFAASGPEVILHTDIALAYYIGDDKVGADGVQTVDKDLCQAFGSRAGEPPLSECSVEPSPTGAAGLTKGRVVRVTSLVQCETTQQCSLWFRYELVDVELDRGELEHWPVHVCPHQCAHPTAISQYSPWRRRPWRRWRPWRRPLPDPDGLEGLDRLLVVFCAHVRQGHASLRTDQHSLRVRTHAIFRWDRWRPNSAS